MFLEELGELLSKITIDYDSTADFYIHIDKSINYVSKQLILLILNMSTSSTHKLGRTLVFVLIPKVLMSP